MAQAAMKVCMGSEGRWERQGLARVRYSVSSFRVLQEVLFFFFFNKVA
jgi:hypothetical protein